jgi:hypothetical protein
MTLQNIRTTILPRLISGARDGLPLDRIGATSPLQALSLAGQAMRFDRPARPAQFVVEEKVEDGRRIIGEPARKLLLRLLGGKSQASEHLADALARTLVERSLRLHPFDLPKLETFVKPRAELLGAEALAFAERGTPSAEKQNYFAPDKLTDETWMLATPAIKARYIAERRAADPDAARALVKASWSSENADNRVRILGAFRDQLSLPDAPFLAGLEKDRAPRVRELAQRLLSRLPGFEGDDPALRAALERVKVGKSGLIFKRTMLSLELPATIKQQFGIAAWINETFSPVGIEKLAAALSLSVDDMIAGVDKDGNLLLAFLIMATRDRRLDLVETITNRLSNAWEAIAQANMSDLDVNDADWRRRWADLVIRPRQWTADAPIWTLPKLVDLLDAPASSTLFADILESKPWKALCNEPGKASSDLIESVAALCPPASRDRLRADLSAFDSGRAGNATLFLDLMDSLEAPNA